MIAIIVIVMLQFLELRNQIHEQLTPISANEDTPITAQQHATTGIGASGIAAMDRC